MKRLRSELAEFERDPLDDERTLGLFGREILSISFARRRSSIDGALKFWRRRGFPYPELTEPEQEQEFRCIKRVAVGEVIRKREIRPSTLGLRLANSFHPQIWTLPAHRHLRAPLDHFASDDTLRKLLERAPRFWPNRRCWNAQCLRSLLRIYGGGRVSNFRPAAARAIISRYSGAGQSVLDFSAGFGGRLLGCLTLDRAYYGIDPAVAQVTGLRRMAHALRPYTETRVTILDGCAEELMPQLAAKSIDLIFSSPPYFNVERYGPEDGQSSRRYTTYEMWKERFLRPILVESHRLLRSGGHAVINVADGDRHAIARDLKEIARTLFRECPQLKLLMHSRPVQRSAGSTSFRWEPVFVFKKKS